MGVYFLASSFTLSSSRSFSSNILYTRVLPSVCFFKITFTFIYMPPPPCLKIVFRGYRYYCTSNNCNSNNKIESAAVQPIGTNRFLLLTGEFIMIIRVLWRPCLYLCRPVNVFPISINIDFTTGFVRNHNTLQYIVVNDDNEDIRNTDISLNINAIMNRFNAFATIIQYNNIICVIEFNSVTTTLPIYATRFIVKKYIINNHVPLT